MPRLALGDEQVRDIDGTLARLASETGGPLTLKFTNHWSDTGEEPALLAAALLGSLRDLELIIEAGDEEAVDGLLRFGVATALSRRPRGSTRFVGLAEARINPARLATLWTPGSRRVTQALFAGEEADPTGAYGPRHATFVNPHLSSGTDGHPDVVFLVRRWLTRRLSEDETLTEVNVSNSVAAAGVVVEELVSNVQEHASAPDFPHPHCLLRLSATAGDAIRCSILDTGVGLDHSLTEALRRTGYSEEELAPTKAPDRLRKLLGGQLPGWDAGRGMGLLKVAEVLGRCKGRMTVATGGLRARLTSIELTVVADAFSLEGTVVDCSIPTAVDQSVSSPPRS